MNNRIAINIIQSCSTQTPNLDRSDTHVHAKSNDSTTYLWHCYLSHIGIKRMKKLHVDGSLDSLVFEKIETCEPCLLVYMHEETPCRWIVWTHLILNHLRHANHTTWARWLKGLVFSKMEQESNLLEVIHLMCAVQWVLRHAVDIKMFLLHRWFE